MRMSDWSSDVCSSDLELQHQDVSLWRRLQQRGQALIQLRVALRVQAPGQEHVLVALDGGLDPDVQAHACSSCVGMRRITFSRLKSEEHTSELQSLMRISYAVFCLKKKNK